MSDSERVKALKGDLSTLQNSIISMGLQGPCFKEAVGSDVALGSHSYEEGWHWIDASDAELFRAAGPGHAAGASAVGRELLDAARWLASEAESLSDKEDLLQGFRNFVSAAARVAPFLVLQTLEHPEGVSPAARDELGSFYAIAQALWAHEELVELVIDRSSPGVLSGLETDFPELHHRILGHVDTFGWLPLRSRQGSMTPKEIVQRLQKLFLRFKAGDLVSLAQQAAEVLPTGTDVLLRAEYLAQPFLQVIAKGIGSTPEQLAFSTTEEVLNALQRSNGLPFEEIQVRMQQIPAPLKGQSVSLGRAVGRARIIQRAAEGTALELGDILVTGLSSPDHGGAASVFPTRTDAAVSVGKAMAIVIDDGGLLSHAAMISREHGIPCLVGTEVATSTLRDGEIIEVDATRGDGRVRRFEP